MVVSSSRTHAYSTAVLVVAGATAVTAGLWPWLTPSTTVLFFPAVMLAATFGGLGPGLVATALSAAAIAYFFMPPYWSFKMSAADLVRLCAFVAATLLITSIANARRRAEAALQEAFQRESETAAARQSERLKAALLDALTHNLRTPLTAIKAAVTALQLDHVTEHADTRRELLHVINEEADRLDRFVGGLGSPTAPTTIRQVGINELLERVREKAAPITRRHRLETEVASNLPAIAVDPAAVIEAVYMVVENAAKYSPVNTAISVRAVRHDVHHAQVTITDEGPGIPAHLRSRVFERFFRLPTTSAIVAGSGLGLTIARQLIGTQGGDIWIDETFQPGTRVIVTLPFSDAMVL